MLCWFLPYNNLNQLYGYIYPPSLEPLSHPPTPSHPPKSSQSTGLSSCVTQQLPTSCLFCTW